MRWTITLSLLFISSPDANYYASRQFILIESKLKLKAFMRGRAEKAMLENAKSGSARPIELFQRCEISIIPHGHEY